ncbi:biotin carboxylase [Amycolatopsis bartoniae]|uniref:ATP-grasp domain-containing protein n=1 Tax=Amycolatopsis bartoniae TaxID=941986 RepID=A0A8H9IZH9_9PSEU|nr:hypothetical protein [Amycolatopsis bartoniae]MBB2938606.1 biotin carboxylase [Amycolatopsis bartoniae]TVT08894.1 hypothetical protein FNH07_10975 [Amycolatopsis bartoniae]GHF69795.1 hypothetical protein GCM10017566_49390 [Amycolatopsis bartoniae]
MTRPRALVLHNGKAAFDEARAPFAREIEFLDLHEAATAPAGAHEVPAFAPERATLAVIDGLLARFPFRHVVTTSESNTAFAAFLRSRYGLAGPRYDQVLPATSKWRMKQQWGHAFPSARCWLPGDFRALATQGRAPAEVVVKPLAGSSTKGVRRLGRQECLDHLAATGELVVVEEAIDLTSELHCDGVVRDGKPRVIVPSVYNRPPLGSAGHNLASIHLPVGDPRRGPAVEAACRVLAAIDVPDFVFHLELLESHGTMRFGEIGFRPPGAGRAPSLLRFYGVDLWAEHIAAQLELPRPTRNGVTAPTGYCGVTGVAADPAGCHPSPPAETLRAIPGVVDVLPGSAHARSEAKLGSSVANTHLVLFSCDSETGAHRVLQEIEAAGRSAPCSR